MHFADVSVATIKIESIDKYYCQAMLTAFAQPEQLANAAWYKAKQLVKEGGYSLSVIYSWLVTNYRPRLRSFYSLYDTIAL